MRNLANVLFCCCIAFALVGCGGPSPAPLENDTPPDGEVEMDALTTEMEMPPE